MESLDFMTFVRTVLDPSLSFDKFDIGSIQIAPTEWPTAPRAKSETGLDKDRHEVPDQIIIKKKNSDQDDKTLCDAKQRPTQNIDAIVRDILQRPWIDPDIKRKELAVAPRRIPPRDEQFETGKKDRQVLQQIIVNNKNSEVKNKGSGAVSCSGFTLPVEVTNTSMEAKLEATKRKLRDQYDKIEAEKKKRRIHVIEFQKPAAVQLQTRARKPSVVKKKPSQRNGLQLVRPAAAATQLHRAHYLSVC